MSVGENIRRLRLRKGITQAELARETGVTQALICQIEKGTKNPSLQTGKEIADALSCGLEELLKSG